MLLVPLLTVLHRVGGPPGGDCRHLELGALVAVELKALPVLVRVRRPLELDHPVRALRALLRLRKLPLLAVHCPALLAVAQRAARAAREHRPGGVFLHLVAVGLRARSQLLERVSAAFGPALDGLGVEHRSVRAREEDVVAVASHPLVPGPAAYLALAAEGQLAAQLALTGLLQCRADAKQRHLVGDVTLARLGAVHAGIRVGVAAKPREEHLILRGTLPVALRVDLNGQFFGDLEGLPVPARGVHALEDRLVRSRRQVVFQGIVCLGVVDDLRVRLEVVEGDGVVRAAVEQLPRRVLVHPEPRPLASGLHLHRKQVVLGPEGEEPLPALVVEGVGGRHADVAEAPGRVRVLPRPGPVAALVRELAVRFDAIETDRESPEALAGKDVARAAVEHKVVPPPVVKQRVPEVIGIVGVEVAEERAHVLYGYEGVEVRLDEPLRLVAKPVADELPSAPHLLPDVPAVGDAVGARHRDRVEVVLDLAVPCAERGVGREPVDLLLAHHQHEPRGVRPPRADRRHQVVLREVILQRPGHWHREDDARAVHGLLLRRGRSRGDRGERRICSSRRRPFPAPSRVVFLVEGRRVGSGGASCSRGGCGRVLAAVHRLVAGGVGAAAHEVELGHEDHHV
mmetsp:Transcript_28017/g.54472  ORF Transcript_28017/g.54472 Transcript_28017/m.54472 type:complete len:627 (-) Transcript_28017:143-2023(-)